MPAPSSRSIHLKEVVLVLSICLEIFLLQLTLDSSFQINKWMKWIISVYLKIYACRYVCLMCLKDTVLNKEGQRWKEIFGPLVAPSNACYHWTRLKWAVENSESSKWVARPLARDHIIWSRVSVIWTTKLKCGHYNRQLISLG